MRRADHPCRIPDDEDAFAQVKPAERQQSGKDRQRTGKENHPRRKQQRRNGNWQQIGRRHQQAQHEEHTDPQPPRHSAKL